MRIVVLFFATQAAAVLVKCDLTAWGAILVAFAAFAVGHRYSWPVTLSAVVSMGISYGVTAQFMSFTPDWWAGMRPMVLAVLAAGAAVGLAVKAGQELTRQRLEQARQDERLSIAQDVHDMVAHHIAVVNVQAGAASHLLKDQPDKAGEALGHVTAASSKALDELGALLGVLREPAVGLAGLPALLDDDVELTVVGAQRPLPATVDITAYRIVQESLTNARKHGTGKATLTLTYEPARLIVETRNRCGHGSGGSGYGLCADCGDRLSVWSCAVAGTSFARLTRVTSPVLHAFVMAKRLRQVLVLLHLMTAFGWLAATLAVLLLSGHPDAALLVDDRLLADFSFMTVYTGLMLAGTAHWGYTRFWWVTVKLAVTLVLALGGRTLFAHGLPVPGGVLMVVAIAVLAWIGRTKPWGRLRPGPSIRPWSHPAIYIAILVTPVLDYVTDLPLQAIPAAAVLVRHAVSAGSGRAGARRSGSEQC
ncbi:hypothetical protein JOF56_003675 [Kibdelosporangium banguiense]|uniref:histidine kinase n=1 Tax=Kibdelosporangium banguiense TaxID=1365924 RepID=A0ABS4TFV1_9PSEU|nr:histidine kinase [Kibdelosporangium banguiense]MBP2323290.1 hypothetical protein [Kibdelosporangium banguiense]